MKLYKLTDKRWKRKEFKKMPEEKEKKEKRKLKLKMKERIMRII